MHATSEYNIHNSKQNKIIQFKAWSAGCFSDYDLLDITSRSESPVQFMFFIAKQYPSRIAYGIMV